MGYLFQGTCYGAAQQVNDAYYGSIPMTLAPAADGSWSQISMFRDFSYSPTTGWSALRDKYNASGVWVSTVVVQQGTMAPMLSVCDPAEPFLDGATIGWGIATAMVLAAGVAFLKRAAR